MYRLVWSYRLYKASMFCSVQGIFIFDWKTFAFSVDENKVKDSAEAHSVTQIVDKNLSTVYGIGISSSFVIFLRYWISNLVDNSLKTLPCREGPKYALLTVVGTKKSGETRENFFWLYKWKWSKEEQFWRGPAHWQFKEKEQVRIPFGTANWERRNRSVVVQCCKTLLKKI